MKNQSTVIVSLIVLVAIFIGGMIFYKKSEAQSVQNLSLNSAGAPFVQPHSPSFGQNKNKVVIVEFLDPQCEACAAFHPAIKKVFDEYEEEVKLVIRYLDFHSDSKHAIKLLEAARKQGKFQEALEVMFKYQPGWAEHRNPKPHLLWDFLLEANLDMKQLRKDYESSFIDGMLNIDRQDAKTLKVRGTPTFFVNGKELKKLSYKGLLDLVESEIIKE